MNAKEAVAARILELCNERGIAINALAGSAGVSPSTVYSMLNAKSQNPGVVSLQKLWVSPCGSFSMTISLTTLSKKSSKQSERCYLLLVKSTPKNKMPTARAVGNIENMF